MSTRRRKSGTRRWLLWVLAHVATPLLYAGVATLAVAAIQTLSTESLLSSAERDVLGWLLLHRPSRPAHPEIVLVAVDDDLFDTELLPDEKPVTPAGKPLVSYRPASCGCQPAPRLCYARAIERLSRWRARTVGLDIMFSKECPVEDRQLGRALEEAGNVVLAAVAKPRPTNRTADPTAAADVLTQTPVFKSQAIVASPTVQPRDREYAIELRQTIRDVDSRQLDECFAMAREIVGLARNQVPGAPEENRLWTPFLVDGTEPRLLGDLFSRSAALPSRASPAPGEVILTPKRGDILLDEAFYRKHLLINFSPGAQPEVGRYAPVRLSWLLSCTDAQGEARFRDRIVLIGYPAGDRHLTLVGDMPGTEVLANAVATMLERRPLRAVPQQWVLLLMLAGASLAVLLVRKLPASQAVLGILLLVGGELALSRVLISRDWWLLTLCPITSLLGATGLIQAWENSRIQEVRARLVPDRFRRILAQTGGFEVQNASVLFSDIRGFTTISETLDPAQVMSCLNRYMAGVDEILRRHGGTFLKCPGDCVVALFQAERRGTSHEERAIRAGIEILQNVERFSQDWRRDTGFELSVGVGINSGPMAVGLLTARHRLEATVIGDAVNTAARIESLTKEYGPLLVSETTLAPVREQFLAHAVGEVTVKGRLQGVRLFLVHVPDETGPPAAGLLSRLRRVIGNADISDAVTGPAGRAPERRS